MNSLIFLDSGLSILRSGATAEDGRRNDEKRGFLTLCESIIFVELKISRLTSRKDIRRKS